MSAYVHTVGGTRFKGDQWVIFPLWPPTNPEVTVENTSKYLSAETTNNVKSTQ